MLSQFFSSNVDSVPCSLSLGHNELIVVFLIAPKWKEMDKTFLPSAWNILFYLWSPVEKIFVYVTILDYINPIHELCVFLTLSDAWHIVFHCKKNGTSAFTSIDMHVSIRLEFLKLHFQKCRHIICHKMPCLAPFLCYRVYNHAPALYRAHWLAQAT